MCSHMYSRHSSVCQILLPAVNILNYPKFKPSTQTDRMYYSIFHLQWCIITFRSKCCISVFGGFFVHDNAFLSVCVEGVLSAHGGPLIYQLLLSQWQWYTTNHRYGPILLYLEGHLAKHLPIQPYKYVASFWNMTCSFERKLHILFWPNLNTINTVYVSRVSLDIQW